jgi:molybdenum cofactor guanylyltransferase
VAPDSEPIGVILAGGRGRRIGGQKATVQLAGKPLVCYPLEAMRRALRDVAILAKADTQLPRLAGVTVWIEPDERQHPLIGITQALALADGRSVLVCACDLPFVTAELLAELAGADLGEAPAVVSATGGEIQPLLGRYEPAAGPLLWDSAEGALREAIAAIAPRTLEVPDAEVLFNVNTPGDLLQASERISQSSGSDQPNVKS